MKRPNHLPLVSIITVNYNGVVLTRALLLSLRRITYVHTEIFVVDNASHESPDILQEEFPEITLLKLDRNLGFAGGNNEAILVARGKYFLLLNNDTEVMPDFLEPLVQLMEARPEIGITSSKLVYFSQPDTIQYAGSYGLNLYTGRGFGRGFGQQDDGRFDDTIKTELAHGAAMMFSRTVVEKTGLMADLYFLYYEEVDFCERVKKAGYEIWYVGTSKVLHKESMTTGKSSPLKTYYMARNRLLFTRRNAKGIALWAAIPFFFLISFPKNVGTLLLRREWTLAKAYIKGVFWNFSHYNIYQNPILSA